MDRVFSYGTFRAGDFSGIAGAVVDMYTEGKQGVLTLEHPEYKVRLHCGWDDSTREKPVFIVRAEGFPVPFAIFGTPGSITEDDLFAAVMNLVGGAAVAQW